MSNSLIARARLRAQLITQPAATPLAVVQRLGGLQAQDYAWGLWAVGMRVEPSTGSATQSAVEEAIARAEIVRTWPMRRTLHLVAAADVRWLLSLTGERLVAQQNTRRRDLGIEDAHVDKARDLWTAALQGGRRLARSAMLESLEAGGVPTDGQRGYHLLVHWALRGQLCLGPMAGKEQTFVLLDEWVAPAPELERDEALANLVQRYFTGHGPATLQDLAWWSGLPLRDLRLGLAAAQPALQNERLDGVEHWMAPGALDNLPDLPDPLFHLAGGFEEMMLGYRAREAVIAPADAERIVPGGNGVFRPIVLRDGFVVGGWQRSIKKKGVAVTVEPFAPAAFAGSAARAALENAAARYGAFLEQPTTLTLEDAAAEGGVTRSFAQ